MSEKSLCGLKFRENIWTKEFFMAVVIALICWIGMCISLVGITELPRCKYGDPRCYFFVQVCDNQLFDQNHMACVYMPKQRKTEGSSEYGLDQVTVPILASVLGVVPGISLVFAMTIKNERSLFSLLEIGKMFIAFDIMLLVVSCMLMDRLTWDCRWWGDEHHPDSPKCEGSYSKYVVGTTFIFATEFLLLCGGIAWAEMERKRVSDDRFEWSDSTATDSVQMNTRVNSDVP